jgi:phenylalanyl-tRNA synthetase beta subunit
MLGLGIENASGHKGMKPVEEIKDNIKKLLEMLGLSSSVIAHFDIKENGVVEVAFDDLLSQLPEPPQELIHYEINRTSKFQKFSLYPFIARDIAVWVSEDTNAEKVESVLREAAGQLLVRLTLFDEYRKDSRISYAFRLVFQSPERTLTNEEVNTIIDTIVAKVTERNWEVR